MAPRAQAFRTGFPSSEGKVPSLGQLELPVRAVSPGAPDPRAGQGWNIKGRDKFGGRENRRHVPCVPPSWGLWTVPGCARS